MNRCFNPCRALFFAALLLSLPSQELYGAEGAEWVALGRNENFRAYLDQRSVQRKGDLARVYQLTDFVTAQWVDERTVIGSIRALVEYDCAQPRARTLALEAYSEQMSEGRLVANEQKPDAEWETAAAGGSAERVWQLVCGK
jgi:hypothetical protein